MLLGYKLVIKTILYRQIELTISYPRILGFQQVDEDLLRWWWGPSETKYANRFHKALCDDAPVSARIGNHINNLLLKIERSGIKPERFSDAVDEVFSFARTVLSMTENCRLLYSTESGMTQDVNQALRLCAAEYLHDFIYHNFLYDQKDHTLDDADVYARANSRGWEFGGYLYELGMSKVETSRDIVGRSETNRYISHQHLLLGMDAAAAIAVHEVGIREQVLYRECEGLIPDDELYRELLHDFRPGRYLSQRYKLALQTKVPEQELEAIMSSESSPIDPREQLSDFLGDRTFLASGLSSNADFHFQVLIKGLLNSVPPVEPVEILRINHAADQDELHPPVSLAVFVHGDWHVFYNIDALGRMKSRVWPLIESLGDRIDLTRIEGVDTNDLLRLCDRAFQYVADQLKAQRGLNGALRGRIPELLAGLLLASSGYHPVKVSLELDNPKEMEIDAIGVKETEEGGECLLVEVKRRSTTQIQLQSELEKFARNVELIRQNKHPVEQALDYSGSIEKVSGLFITMADIGEINSRGTEEATEEPYIGFIEAFILPGRGKVETEFKSFIDSLSDIQFWDFNRFNSELNAAGLPELPIRLLERANLIWESLPFTLEDSSDIFDIIAQAAANSNWQWPDNVNAVQTRLEEMLRSG